MRPGLAGGRWAPLALASLAALACTLRLGVARAEDLVLIDADPTWRDAVAVALEPWGSVVGTVDGQPMPTDLSPRERGARWAARSEARVVVWFEGALEGSVLWVFDATTSAAIGRDLPTRPPFDAPTSAAIALSLKTTLRHSAIGPDAPTPPPATVALDADIPPEPARTPPSWTFELAVGARFFATEPAEAEARMHARVVRWFDALERRVGLGARVASGLGAPVSHPRFDGRWVESAVELVLAGRLELVAGLELGAALGAGVSVSALVGELASTQQEVVDTRANLSLSGGVELGWRLSPTLALEARVGADGLPWRQRYLAGGEPVLGVRGIGFTSSLGLEVALDR